MREILRLFTALVLYATLASSIAGLNALAQEVKEQSFGASQGVKIKVRMEGPYTADTPLQVVCYFRYTPDRAKRMTGAPVELDKELGGVLAALRERGEFEGEALDTLVLIPPNGSIKAKALLLVGLGEEDALSPALMERVGTAALREASRLGVRRVAFAPLLRDQGNTKLGTGDVESAVVKGMLLAYDTERRLQKEGLARAWTLEEWDVEAGPAYFDQTTVGVKRGISEADASIATRKATPHARKK